VQLVINAALGVEVGGEETIMLPGEVPLEMVWIEPGIFMMGCYTDEQDSYTNEEPQHEVTVSGFWMGKYEVTKAQWEAVMGTKPWLGQDHVIDNPYSPAVYVSWIHAKEFITELNSYTGKTFRLPSDAEWEYACRAGTTTRFYWGDDPDYTVGNDYAWWNYNAGNASEAYAHVVGQKLPNAVGLYDMSGNCWEWCEDDYSYSYTDAPTDGSPWVNSPRSLLRVRRGGAWNYFGDLCRSASRGSYSPWELFSHGGFRLAR
jgi:formylglycine-generating enzyme required for sulfatase activity